MRNQTRHISRRCLFGEDACRAGISIDRVIERPVFRQGSGIPDFFRAPENIEEEMRRAKSRTMDLDHVVVDVYRIDIQPLRPPQFPPEGSPA